MPGSNNYIPIIFFIILLRWYMDNIYPEKDYVMPSDIVKTGCIICGTDIIDKNMDQICLGWC